MSQVVTAGASLSMFAALLVGCAASPSTTTAATGVDVADIVEDVMGSAISADATADLDRCIGAVVAVVTPEQTLVMGFGATEAGGATAPDADSLFQIGSISKVFTGLALARVVARGDARATDPAHTFLAADLAVPFGASPSTLADLVTHHSGLPEMPANLVDRDGNGARDSGADPLSPATGYSRLDLARYFDTVGPPAPASYRYSNLGVGLLGLALQDRFGLADFDTLLHQLVIDDIGMNNTWGLVSAMDGDALGRLVASYAVVNDRRVAGRPSEMGVLAAAGEVATSGNDMARFLAALTGIAPSPLDDAIALGITPLASGPTAEIDIGFALEIEHLADGDRFSKGGATMSATAFLSFRRDPAVGVIVMTSCGSFTSVKALANEINDRVAAR